MAQNPDLFADIGNKVSAIRTNLLEAKEPALLPDIQLPFTSGGKSGFAPINRLDTQDQLQIELEKYRTKFSSFLKSYAPPVIESRISVALKEFNWRTENDTDRKDFLSVVNGKES